MRHPIIMPASGVRRQLTPVSAPPTLGQLRGTNAGYGYIAHAGCAFIMHLSRSHLPSSDGDHTPQATCSELRLKANRPASIQAVIDGPAIPAPKGGWGKRTCQREKSQSQGTSMRPARISKVWKLIGPIGLMVAFLHASPADAAPVQCRSGLYALKDMPVSKVGCAFARECRLTMCVSVACVVLLDGREASKLEPVIILVRSTHCGNIRN
jgi:hypothetical protein